MKNRFPYSSNPVLEWDSKAFEYVMKYAGRQGTEIAVPQEGDVLRLGEATVTVLHCWPEAAAQGRTNDMSIVLRVDYGKTSFLFTGDAEVLSRLRAVGAKVLRAFRPGHIPGPELRVDLAEFFLSVDIFLVHLDDPRAVRRRSSGSTISV